MRNDSEKLTDRDGIAVRRARHELSCKCYSGAGSELST